MTAAAAAAAASVASANAVAVASVANAKAFANANAVANAADIYVSHTKLSFSFRKGYTLDAVVIETTGMADPAPVAQTFFVDEEIQKYYKLDGIVTLVDAKHIEQVRGGGRPA